MVGVTLFGIFLTPVFYYVLQWFGARIVAVPHPAAPPAAVTTGDGVALQTGITERKDTEKRSNPS